MAELDQQDKIDEQAHAMDLLDKVNIYKFIFTSNNCLKNKQNQLVCTFSVDETDEWVVPLDGRVAALDERAAAVDERVAAVDKRVAAVDER